MKKLLYILTIISLVFLSGCSMLTPEKTKVFELKDNSAEYRVEISHKDDTVTKQKFIITIKLDGELTVDNIKPALEKEKKQVSGLKGISYETDYQSDKIVTTISIDFTQAKSEDIGKIPGMTGVNVSNGISLEATEKGLLNSGYKEVQ